MSFDKNKIKELYPEAEELMYEAGLIWKLPAGKEYMLSEICESGDYFLEEKIDGALYQTIKTENHCYLFGRTISKTTGLLTEKGENVPHITEAFDNLPPNTVLIGEIYVSGGTSKDVTHIMGCLPREAIKRQEKEGLINYYVHDIIFYDGVDLMNTGAEIRYNILKAIWKKHNLEQYNFLRLAVKVDNNLEEEISRILNSGGEGAVLKKKTSLYVPGKRPAWETIKVKQMDSVDLVCMGFCSPTKEYTGKELETWEYWEKKESSIPSYTQKVEGKMYSNEDYIPVTKPYFYGWPSAIEIGAYDEQGNLKLLGTVSSGLTDEDKQGMAQRPKDYLNKVVSLDCMSIDKKEQTLRHPVLKAWRHDKNANECLISEIFS